MWEKEEEEDDLVALIQHNSKELVIPQFIYIFPSEASFNFQSNLCVNHFLQTHSIVPE